MRAPLGEIITKPRDKNPIPRSRRPLRDVDVIPKEGDLNSAESPSKTAKYNANKGVPPGNFPFETRKFPGEGAGEGIELRERGCG